MSQTGDFPDYNENRVDRNDNLLTEGVKPDLAEANDDLKELSSGKSLFKLEGEKFDIDRYNRLFEQYKVRRREEMQKRLDEKLAELNKPKIQRPVYQSPIGEIMVNTKDAIFDIMDDLLQYKFTYDTFTKHNRLFYLGITIIFISLFIYLFVILVGESDNREDNNTLKIKHIHKILQQ